MPLDTDLQEKLKSLAKLWAADSTRNLRMLLNTPLELSFKEIPGSRMAGDEISIKENSVLVTTAFQDESLGLISLIAKEKNGNAVADLMMGGSGESSGEFDETRQMAFNEAVSQTMKAVAERLTNLKDGLNLTLKDSEYLLLSPVKKNTLKVPPSVKDSIAIKFFINVPSAFDAEFEIEMNSEALSKIIEEYYDEALKIDLDEILADEGTSNNSGTDLESDEDIAAAVAGVNFANMKDNSDPNQIDEERNLNLLLDIKMGLIVELGRADMPLKDILKLTKGSVIELDRLSGEPVDLFVNNKLIARGEVVVIDDNFGLRITQLAGNLNLKQELGHMLTAGAD